METNEKEHNLTTCSYFACHAGLGDRCPYVANPEYAPQPSHDWLTEILGHLPRLGEISSITGKPVGVDDLVVAQVDAAIRQAIKDRLGLEYNN